MSAGLARMPLTRVIGDDCGDVLRRQRGGLHGRPPHRQHGVCVREEPGSHLRRVGVEHDVGGQEEGAGEVVPQHEGTEEPRAANIQAVRANLFLTEVRARGGARVNRTSGWKASLALTGLARRRSCSVLR